MNAVDAEGRIREVAHDPEFPVFTAWDLGRTDDTAIWWYQNIGKEIRVLDYFAESGGSIEDFDEEKGGWVPGSITREILKRSHYRYGRHWLPHDARARTLAAEGKSIVEKLSKYLGHGALAIVPNISVEDGIQAARSVLPRCYFDENCNAGPASGVEALRQYQREYDEDKKAFRKIPLHNWASHPADAFRMLAVAERREVIPVPVFKPAPVFPDPTVLTLDELWARKDEREALEVRL